MKIIDVQKELTACVRKLGAVVSDDERGSSKARNADYWFPNDQVIAELKCLNQSYFDDKSYMEWLSKLYHDWVARQLAPPLAAKSTFNLADLPKECTDDVTSLVRNRLESALKDANSQIKTTRKTLGADDARGLVILVNDGNFGLHPGLVQNAMARSLHKYSGINTIIHFTANMASRVDGISRDVRFWCVWSAKRFKPPVDSCFLERFREAWFAHHQSVVGEPISTLQGDAASLYSAKFTAL